MKKGVRVLLVFLSMLMLFTLAGCKKKNTNTIDKSTIYKEEIIGEITGKNTYVEATAMAENYFFFTKYSWNETDYVAKNTCCSFNLKTGEIKEFDISVSSNGWVQGIQALPDDKLMMMISEYFEDASDPENYIFESHNYISIFDAQGKELKKQDMAELGLEWVNTFLSLKNGNIILGDGSNMLILDNNLKVINKIEMSESVYYDSFFTLKDGTLLARYWDQNSEKSVCAILDPNTMENKGEFDFGIDNFTSYSTYPGKKHDFLLYSANQVYGFNVGSEPEPLMNTINSDLYASYFNTLSEQEDGSIIGTYNEWDGEGDRYVIARYTKVPEDQYVEKELISLGGTYINSEVRKKVIDFNKSSDTYRFLIKDYSEYDNENNWNAGSEQFDRDIAAGQGPDIIFTSDSRMISKYASKGLFMDLNKFLDKDEIINKDNLMPNLLEASSFDDKLVLLVPSYYIQTVEGVASVVGNRTSWTYEDMININNSLPEGTKLFNYGSRDSFLNNMLTVNADDFVNYEKAECYFNTAEFKKVCEFLKSLPQEGSIDGPIAVYDYDMAFENVDYNSLWRSKKVILQETTFSDANELIYGKYGTFGGDMTFIGYPCKEGQGSVIRFNAGYAISSKCSNPDAAWDFIKTFWSEEYQNSNEMYAFSALKSVFEAKCKKAMERPYWEDENGNKEYYDYTYWNGETDEVLPYLTQAEVDEFKNFVYSINKRSGDATELYDIISEELQPFYEGQKNVDEVCEIIQSRCSIFLKEKQ